MFIFSTVRSTTWLADCIVVALLLIAFKAGLSVIRMGIIRSNKDVICEPKVLAAYYWTQQRALLSAEVCRSRSADDRILKASLF